MSTEVFVEFIGSTLGLKAALDDAVTQVDRLGKRSGTTSEQVGKFATLALAAVGTAAVGVAVQSVKAAIAFQDAMVLIQTQAGRSKEEVAHLSDGILAMAGQVGYAPEELATSLYHVESTLSDSLTPTQRYAAAMEQVKIAAEGAKTGHANLEDVTNALTATMSAGMVQAGHMDTAMGALNATVGAGDMKMQDLADALGTGMLVQVKGFGVSLNDVGAALATFGDNNLRGRDAATQLRMAVQYMAVGSSKGGKALAELGLTQGQLAHDMATGGLGKAVTDLHDHLVKTGHTGADMGQILMEAFGKKAGTGISTLMQEYDRFQQKEKQVADGGATFAQSWAAQQETVHQKLDQARASVEALGVRLGNLLLPAVTGLMDALSAATGWLTRHKAALDIIVGVVGTLLVGALAVAIGAVVSFVAALSPAILIVAGVAAGIAALVGGLIAAYESSGTFRQIVGDAVAWVQHAWTDAWGVIGPLLSEFAQWLKVHVPQAVDALRSFVMDKVGGLVTWWKSHWDEIRLVVHVAMDLLKVILTSDLAFVIDIAKGAWQVIKDAASTAWSLIKDTVSLAIDVVKTVVGVGLDLITGHWGRAWHDLVNGMGAIFGDLFHIIRDAFSGAARLLFDAGGAIIRGLIDGIKGAIGGVKSVLGDLTSSIAQWKGPPEKDATLLHPAGQLIINGLIAGMASRTSAVQAHLGGLTSQIAAAVNTDPNIRYATDFTGVAPMPGGDDLTASTDTSWAGAGLGGSFGGGGASVDTLVATVTKVGDLAHADQVAAAERLTTAQTVALATRAEQRAAAAAHLLALRELAAGVKDAANTAHTDAVTSQAVLGQVRAAVAGIGPALAVAQTTAARAR